jgi:hypothetical protein
MPFDRGPYVQVACICETVIEDKAGVISLIRIIDVLTHEARGPNPPEQMVPIQFRGKLVLMLKSGETRGRHDLTIQPELPSGELENPITMSVHFEGDERGQNLITDLQFVFKHEGLHWFNVHINDEKLTSIPFLIRYQRLITGPTPPP